MAPHLFGVGDAQRAHAVLVAPLPEVALKGAAAPVGRAACGCKVHKGFGKEVAVHLGLWQMPCATIGTPHCWTQPLLSCVCPVAALDASSGPAEAASTPMKLHHTAKSQPPRTRPGPPLTADLALELQVESVQLVEPVGDGLAVPAQRQLERVVHKLVLLIALVARGGSGLLWEGQWGRIRHACAVAAQAGAARESGNAWSS